MSIRHRISRTTTTALTLSALTLIASLGLSSVAWSSDPSAAQRLQLQRPSQQDIEKILEQDAAKVRASVCKGSHRRQFRCRGGKPTRWNLRNRKLLRSYLNLSNPKCPAWSVKRPWTGYATIATSAAAICVKEARGYDIAGGTFRLNRGPLTATLSLRGRIDVVNPPYFIGWLTVGQWNTGGTMGSGGAMGGCIGAPVNYSVWVLNVRAVVLCSVSLFVAAPAFPPIGEYHGILSVTSRGTNEVLLNAVRSEPLCYFYPCS